MERVFEALGSDEVAKEKVKRLQGGSFGRKRERSVRRLREGAVRTKSKLDHTVKGGESGASQPVGICWVP